MDILLWFAFLGLVFFVGFLVQQGMFGTLFWLFLFPGMCFGGLVTLKFVSSVAFAICFFLFLAFVPYIAIYKAFEPN